MPRVRLTARGWLALAGVVGAGVCATAAVAAPPGSAGRRSAPTVNAAAARPGESDGRRRDEIDALQRQDAAEALKKHFNIDVDWRTTPLDRLVDIRVRAAKAAELQERLGVSVDWQQYSWIELEALRRTLLSFERYRGDTPETTGAGPAAVAAGQQTQPQRARRAEDGLVAPTFKGRPAAPSGRPTDPDGVIRPTFAGRPAVSTVARDPDGVIRPTFAGHPRWSAAVVDPDGLITPTFTAFEPAARTAGAAADDDDDVMDPSRADEIPPAPMRW